MTQPRKSRTGEVGEVGGGGGRLLRDTPPPTLPNLLRPPPTFGFVAASIPIANRTRPQPASQRGIPVARNARAKAYTTRDTPAPVMAPRARRASAGTPRWPAIRARAAARPWP